MKSVLFIAFLVIQLGISAPSVCLADHHPSLLRLSQHTLKHNKAFTFQIHNKQAPITIIRNKNGTFFEGKCSTLELMGGGKTHQYQAVSFSFKYPLQHRIAQISQQAIQMQILYDLKGQGSKNWKHKRVALSITFVVTEYASNGGFTLGNQINQQLSNGVILQLNKMLPLVEGLSMVLYRGIHSEYPSDQSFLWLVRRQMLMISEVQFQIVKDFIFEHISKEEIEYHGLLKHMSDLNLIQENKKQSKQRESFSVSDI